MTERLEPVSYRERLGELFNVHKDLKGGGTEDGPGPSQRCSVTGQWVQAVTQEVLPEHQKPPFTVKVTEHWCRLPRKVVESPCLEIFKGYQILVTLLEQWGGTRRPPEVPSHLSFGLWDLLWGEIGGNGDSGEKQCPSLGT